MTLGLNRRISSVAPSWLWGLGGGTSQRFHRSLSGVPSSVRTALPPPGTKVYACLSGGVDSAVSARILLEAGCDLSPVFMRNWDTLDEGIAGTGGCEWEKDWADVERICRNNLGGVKPILVDLSKEYWNHVFQPSLDAWAAGLTPNPDVICNARIKFKALPEVLLATDTSAWMATGHYARLLPSMYNSGTPTLHRALFATKDQSYYLCTSSLEVLKRTVFPVGEMKKEDVKLLARKWGIHVAEREESMGICFIGERKSFCGWLDNYLPSNPGPISDADGQKLGSHEGLWHYTIGQRVKLPGLRERMFVGRKDKELNSIIAVPKNSDMLQCSIIYTNDFQGLSLPLELSPTSCYSIDHLEVQTRSLPYLENELYASDCKVEVKGSRLAISLLRSIPDVSPGQTVALYSGTECLGGGTIESIRSVWDQRQDRSDILAASRAI